MHASFIRDLRNVEVNERERLVVRISRRVVRITRDCIVFEQSNVPPLGELGVDEVGLVFIHDNLIGLESIFAHS